MLLRHVNIEIELNCYFTHMIFALPVVSPPFVFLSPALSSLSSCNYFKAKTLSDSLFCNLPSTLFDSVKF